jgi:hypothetical protein
LWFYIIRQNTTQGHPQNPSEKVNEKLYFSLHTSTIIFVLSTVKYLSL